LGMTTFDYKQPGGSIGTAYDTDLQAADLVRLGLSSDAVLRLRLTSGLPLARIKQAAGISARSRSRRLSPEESERLLRVSRVFERATGLFDGDPADARRWLETPLPVLGGRRPLDMAMTEPGARGVEDLIGRIGHGIVS
jgi:putative toxin-antitoxin system antitoxin component (TIGR02293 family)